MTQARTFKLDEAGQPMKGEDVKVWQQRIKGLFKKMDIDCPIEPDGTYGVNTRSFTAALCHASGLSSGKAMCNGVTSELRTKLRNNDLTPAQRKTKGSKARRDYRQKLRRQWAVKKVHPPVNAILEDSWGYVPGVHDGLDVICKANAAVFAMVKGRVFDVRTEGWWSKSPSGDVSKGDGIVQIEVLETVGPFVKGMHIGYGHCEHPRVKAGDIVEAGEVIALAGLANLWHVHLMVNDGSTTRGKGNRNPRPLLDYSVKHG